MTDNELGERIIALAPAMYRVSCGLLFVEQDREDAVQSAIEKAWRKIGTLKAEEKLKPWLIRILINECYTIGRRRQREVLLDALPESCAPDDGEAAALREALMRLNQTERLPLMLHYMEGFSISEIAFLTRCPKGTVLSRMDRGRRQLKELLSRE